MPPVTDDLILDDEEANESSDDDFNPTAAAAEDDDALSSSSEDEADAGKSAPRGRKRKRKAPVTLPDELDSGDEVTIQQARKRKAKKRKGEKGAVDEDEDLDVILSDDEGGEGGLIKTRAQRRVEQKARKPLAGIEGATVDVDALWAQMQAAPIRPIPVLTAPEKSSVDVADAVRPATEVDGADLVPIKKIYTFAGQRTTEEKQVPRSALPQYLSDGWKEAATAATAATPAPQIQVTDTEQPATQPEKTSSKKARANIRRPLRRPSRFDPNPTGYVRALPPEHQLTYPRKPAIPVASSDENATPNNMPTPTEAAIPTTRPEKAQKLNVVDKSRLDWTGFVDKEGIAEELDVHGRTKEAYLGRMEFLAGVEMRKEEERRRLKTKGAGPS